MGRKRNASVNVLFQWVRSQSMKVKILLGAFLALCGLVALKLWVKNHQHFFIASETIHFLGIIVLIYKLTIQKTCSGLSLKTQELTAGFVAVRLVCNTLIKVDVHAVIDLATLISTAWLIYMIRFKLKSTYIKELDNFRLYFVVIPAATLALVFNPYTLPSLSGRIASVLWAFGWYIEAVSVLPQLRLMQNAKMIEPFTSHYVFALGISRFFACAHWIIMLYETKGRYLFLVGYGYLWIVAAFLCEMLQTFILADFCYYYIKSYVQGQLIMKMPV
ncbi:uncharacterized protein LOC126782753 [Argentina anserina]|uniref:uncharacterized protein LOC126782753 n=1 Tax=Argentina anserina TaxID=57926 RepID=UPI0021766B95|nr:uncharacterized protein LOC126782753 [Potentilla anserina]